MQYNYILTTALNAGTAISMVMIFLALTLPKMGGIELNWWGNRSVPYATLQLNYYYLTLPPTVCGGKQQTQMACPSNLYPNRDLLGPPNALNLHPATA